MKYKIGIFLLLSYLCHVSLGQVSYENRLEIELKDEYENEKVHEFAEKGFLISAVNSKSKGKEDEWKFESFDTDLKAIDEKHLFINDDLRLDETVSTQVRLHALFKDKKGNYELLSIDAGGLAHERVSGSFMKKAYVRDMAVLGDYAFFNASIKGTPYLFSINWKTGEQKLIPISVLNVKPKKLKILGFQYIEESSEMLLFVNYEAVKNETDLYMVKLNPNGEKDAEYNLSKEIDQNLVSATASYLSTNNFVITGTYSSKSTSSSEGIYFAQVYKDEIGFINFYNYLDLENFLNYLPEKRQKKLENKKERKEKRGKEYTRNYLMVSHEILNLKDGFIQLGEAYYKTYRTETYTTTQVVNGVTQTRTETRQVFDGYQYTHAILAKFNINGELVWDQTFEMWPTYKPFTVKRFISVSDVTENSINMVYLSRNRIHSKAFDYNGEVLLDRESEVLETEFSGDELKGMAITNIDYWYDNYFIAFGTQKIINKGDKEVDRKRKVFFVSKIKYEANPEE